MRCLILAAGYATRLYPLTENFPKPLLMVGDKTILDWLVDDLAPEIEEFIVVSNHKFIDCFCAWAETKPLNIKVVDDGTTENEHRLGAVRDIVLGLDGRPDSDVLVMAGDNVLDFSLRRFVAFFREKGASCVMTHEENRPEQQRKTAIITMDEARRITSYEEKPAEPKGNHAVPPFYCYRAADVRRAEEALADGCSPDAPGSLAAWLSFRVPMYAYKMPGKRYDIGDAVSYAKVQETYRGIIID